jgi:hypothetical protein
MGMSAYVLTRVLPVRAVEFERLVSACADPETLRFALSALGRWLETLDRRELAEAVAARPALDREGYVANYIAAMVETASVSSGVSPPAWVATIAALREPVFGSALEALRLHLLTHSPPPFRRRNLFIDASLGERV